MRQKEKERTRARKNEREGEETVFGPRFADRNPRERRGRRGERY